MNPGDGVIDQFRQLSQIWFPLLFNYGNDLFLVLATVEIGLACLLWVAHRAGAENIGAGLLRKFLYLGLMYAILLNAESWLPAIIRSFMVAGQQAAHIETLNPGEVFHAGLSVALKMLMELRFWSFFYNFTGMMVGLVAALLVIFAFGLIAIEMAITLIESYIMIGVSAFLLGFAAFRGTASISERFLSFTIGVGLKLFTIYLIIGAGTVLAPQWAALITQTSMLDFAVPFTIAFAAVMYATVALKIPQLAGALASGSVSMSFHDVLGAATTATRVAASVGTAGAAGVVGGGVGLAAARVGMAASQAAGGGVMGALKGGIAAGGAAVGAASQAAVPRLARAQESIARRNP